MLLRCRSPLYVPHLLFRCLPCSGGGGGCCWSCRLSAHRDHLRLVVLVCYPCASAVSTGHVLSLFPPAAMLCLPFDGSRLILESYFLFLGGRCHGWIRGRNPLLGHSPRIGPIVSAVRFGSRRSLLLFAPSDRLLHFRVFLHAQLAMLWRRRRLLVPTILPTASTSARLSLSADPVFCFLLVMCCSSSRRHAVFAHSNAFV